MIAPPAADAAYYLSRAKASSLAFATARKKALAHVDGGHATCYPSFRKHTSKNLRARWHLWDCTWSLNLSQADGSTARCTGKVRITGSRRSAGKVKSLGGKCRTLSGPKPPAPAPAPNPTPPPPPAPTPPAGQGPPSAQDIVNHALAYARALAYDYVGTVPNTYRASWSDCHMIRADTARCTVLRWVDDGIAGTDGIGEVHNISFWRVYSFSQWLTTGGYYDDYPMAFDLFDPAQTCQAHAPARDDFFNCSAVRPGA